MKALLQRHRAFMMLGCTFGSWRIGEEIPLQGFVQTKDIHQGWWVMFRKMLLNFICFPLPSPTAWLNLCQSISFKHKKLPPSCYFLIIVATNAVVFKTILTTTRASLLTASLVIKVITALIKKGVVVAHVVSVKVKPPVPVRVFQVLKVPSRVQKQADLFDWRPKIAPTVGAGGHVGMCACVGMCMCACASVCVSLCVCVQGVQGLPNSSSAPLVNSTVDPFINGRNHFQKRGHGINQCTGAIYLDPL